MVMIGGERRVGNMFQAKELQCRTSFPELLQKPPLWSCLLPLSVQYRKRLGRVGVILPCIGLFMPSLTEMLSMSVHCLKIK